MKQVKVHSPVPTTSVVNVIPFPEIYIGHRDILTVNLPSGVNNDCGLFAAGVSTTPVVNNDKSGQQ